MTITMAPDSFQELVKIYLEDTDNRQRHNKLTIKREESLPGLHTIITDFIEGKTSLASFRDQLDDALNPADVWFAQGRFMMEIRKFAKNHNDKSNQSAEDFRSILLKLRELKDSQTINRRENPSLMSPQWGDLIVGKTIEESYNFFQRERERLRHEGKSSGMPVAPGNSANIISLFAFWLYPDKEIMICNDGVRRGLKTLIKNKIIPFNQALKLNYSTIEITTAEQYTGFQQAQIDLLRIAPQLNISPFWTENFFYWLQAYQEALTTQTSTQIKEQDDSEVLATAPTRTSIVREVGEELNWTVRQSEIAASAKADDPLLIKHEPLLPTAEPLLTHLIREVQRHILVDEQVIRRIYRALLAGHVILTGPPGTGKTELAHLIPEILWQSPVDEAALITDDETEMAELTTETAYTTRIVTATDEWSPRTLISGIAPQIIDGVVTYKIQYGHLTAAILKNWSLGDQQPDAWITLLRRTKLIANSNVERGKVKTFRGQWLVIDEFNRAPIDLALGDALTSLGGSDVLRVMIENGGSAELPIPRDFRIIGTLNSFDRNYLNQISEALKRRFSFIEILPPTRAQRVAEEGIVLYKALKKIIHLSTTIYDEDNVLTWGDDLTISGESDSQHFISWNNDGIPFREAFLLAWDLFEVIRIYRQLGTAQAISLIQQMLITGILNGYETTSQDTFQGAINEWIEHALDSALCDTIADQLQVLLPDEIETLYLYLTTPRQRFSGVYNTYLANLVDRKQRLYGQLIALNNVCDAMGQPILTDAEVEQIMHMEQPKIEQDKLQALFHLDQHEEIADAMLTLPQFTRRLRTFKMERGL